MLHAEVIICVELEHLEGVIERFFDRIDSVELEKLVYECIATPHVWTRPLEAPELTVPLAALLECIRRRIHVPGMHTQRDPLSLKTRPRFLDLAAVRLVRWPVRGVVFFAAV